MLYEIVVSSGGAPVWDSGKVASNATTNIPYGGSSLKADADYTWSVTWWDANGTMSAPVSGSFSTGLSAASGWAGAAWVGPQAGHNMLRSTFTVMGSTIRRARLYIVGLGYYHSWINGGATDGHVLGPFTTFEVRPSLGRCVAVRGVGCGR